MDVVRGYLQPYDWGAVDGLARWAGPTGGPQAELWFGTHPNGPSPCRDGEGTARARMPILTKLLAAARPLSIQIHPPAQMARARYAAQEADPAMARLLSDPFPKAEILIALEPFVILEGFRDPPQSVRVFERLGVALQPATEALRDGDIPGCVRVLLALPGDDVRAAAEHLPAAFGAAGLPGHARDVIEEVVGCFPGDAGVFVAALLNARTLQPGQAVYVEPGTVHAYVRGAGVEVMTNSDNVLRLGLTSKTVAVDEALAATTVGAQPHPCDPAEIDGVRTYAPAGAPFLVHAVAGAGFTAESGAARTVVCLHGAVRADGVRLAPGDGLLVEAGEAAVDLDVAGMAVVARHVP